MDEPVWMIFPDYPIPEQYLNQAVEWADEYAAAAKDPESYKRHTGNDFDPDDLIMGYASAVTEMGSQLNANNPNDHYETSEECVSALEHVMMYGQNIWLYTLTYIRNTYNIDHFNECGYLLCMSTIGYNMGEDKIGKYLYEASANVLTGIWEALVEYSSDPKNGPFVTVEPDEESISRIVKSLEGADEQLIGEFMKTFQKLGTFKSDPSEYQTDEERELYNKMISIYRKMLGE